MAKARAVLTVDDFFNLNTTFKFIPHHFITQKGIGKAVCKSCGLVALNNKLTRWAVNKGCLNEYHSGYSAALKRYSTTKF